MSSGLEKVIIPDTEESPFPDFPKEVIVEISGRGENSTAYSRNGFVMYVGTNIIIGKLKWIRLKGNCPLPMRLASLVAYGKEIAMPQSSLSMEGITLSTFTSQFLLYPISAVYKNKRSGVMVEGRICDENSDIEVTLLYNVDGYSP